LLIFFYPQLVWDEIEIKWKSGDPNSTPNPSFYSQPIYLEKIRIGGGLPQSSTASLASFLPNGAPEFTQSAVWPKESSQSWMNFRRVLTLTTLPTSSNPSFPDLLEITITPNPANNNTQWQAAFQCLEEFDCTDCTFDNWSSNLPKISQIHLQKDYTCSGQRIEFTISGCYDNSDFLENLGFNPLTSLNGDLISSNSDVTNGTLYAPLQPNSFINLLGNEICYSQGNNVSTSCGPSSTGTITLNNTPGQIRLTFDSYNDFLYYYNDLNYIVGQYPGLVTCPGTTDVTYYKVYTLNIPIQQSPTANCGDNSTFPIIGFSYLDYINTTYINLGNPNASTWEILIPRTPIVNCYPPNPCFQCPASVNQFINNVANYRITANPVLSFTTTVGAKCQNPFGVWYMTPMVVVPGASGSVCKDTWLRQNRIKWYNVSTIPFVPSPSSPTGWVNLTNLMTTIPCNFDPYGNYTSLPWDGLLLVANKMYYKVRFPSLTGSFNYSLSTNDFEVYTQTNISNTGSYDVTNAYPIPCPDPSSSLIYSYIGGVPTVYSASYFVGGSPTLIIDP